MTTSLLQLELNIALIPNDKIAERLVDASEGLARRHSAIVRLSHATARLVMAPHLTLYQVSLKLADIEEAIRRLAALMVGRDAFALTAITYTYNEGEASLEVGYETPKLLVEFQTAIIAALNPLRGELLLERDPAGNEMWDLLQNHGRLGDNVRVTGYAEIGDPRQGGLFRPHATLNWFELGTRIDIAAEPLPPIETLSGSYDALGIYLLGPYGTCPQLLRRWDM